MVPRKARALVIEFLFFAFIGWVVWLVLGALEVVPFGPHDSFLEKLPAFLVFVVVVPAGIETRRWWVYVAAERTKGVVRAFLEEWLLLAPLGFGLWLFLVAMRGFRSEGILLGLLACIVALPAGVIWVRQWWDEYVFAVSEQRVLDVLEKYKLL